MPHNSMPHTSSRPTGIFRPTCKARSIMPERLRGKCRPKCHVARHLFNLTSADDGGLDRSALDLATAARKAQAGRSCLVAQCLVIRRRHARIVFGGATRRGTEPHDPMGTPSQPRLAHGSPVPAQSRLRPSRDTFVFAEGRCATGGVSELLGVVVQIEMLELQGRRLAPRIGPGFSGPRDAGNVAQARLRPCGGAGRLPPSIGFCVMPFTTVGSGRPAASSIVGAKSMTC